MSGGQSLWAVGLLSILDLKRSQRCEWKDGKGGFIAGAMGPSADA